MCCVQSLITKCVRHNEGIMTVTSSDGRFSNDGERTWWHFQYISSARGSINWLKFHCNLFSFFIRIQLISNRISNLINYHHLSNGLPSNTRQAIYRTYVYTSPGTSELKFILSLFSVDETDEWTITICKMHYTDILPVWNISAVLKLQPNLPFDHQHNTIFAVFRI